MKTLTDENNEGEPEPVAQLVVDVGVRITRFVRRAIRSRPPSALAISPLRTLAYVDGASDVCVSDVADHLLVGVPTASKLVDELVERELLTRRSDERDRRRVILESTSTGRTLLRSAARPAQEEVAALLLQLTPEEQDRVQEGARLLRSLLTPSGDRASRG